MGGCPMTTNDLELRNCDDVPGIHPRPPPALAATSNIRKTRAHHNNFVSKVSASTASWNYP